MECQLDKNKHFRDILFFNLSIKAPKLFATCILGTSRKNFRMVHDILPDISSAEKFEFVKKGNNL